VWPRRSIGREPTSAAVVSTTPAVGGEHDASGGGSGSGSGSGSASASASGSGSGTWWRWQRQRRSSHGVHR
jgi:hypothetical protein